MSEKYYSAQQVARYFGVKQKTVHAWLRRGYLSGVKLPGTRDWRITEEDIRRFELAARRKAVQDVR